MPSSGKCHSSDYLKLQRASNSFKKRTKQLVPKLLVNWSQKKHRQFHVVRLKAWQTVTEKEGKKNNCHQSNITDRKWQTRCRIVVKHRPKWQQKWIIISMMKSQQNRSLTMRPAIQRLLESTSYKQKCIFGVWRRKPRPLKGPTAWFSLHFKMFTFWGKKPPMLLIQTVLEYMFEPFIK